MRSWIPRFLRVLLLKHLLVIEQFQYNFQKKSLKQFKKVVSENSVWISQNSVHNLRAYLSVTIDGLVWSNALPIFFVRQAGCFFSVGP